MQISNIILKYPNIFNKYMRIYLNNAYWLLAKWMYAYRKQAIGKYLSNKKSVKSVIIHTYMNTVLKIKIITKESQIDNNFCYIVINMKYL